MKILIIGSTKGDIDLINEYIDKSRVDAVLCTGDLGLFYRNENTSTLPKSFTKSCFYEYLEGIKKFKKPVISVRGAHDNLSLCKQLVKKSIKVHNFTLLDDGETVSIDNNTIDDMGISTIKISGIGGSYSPKNYDSKKLIGNARRHFSRHQVDKIKKDTTHLLLMHDLIGDCSKKKINFSDETLSLLSSSEPLYCFVGKYHWWGHAKLANSNVVLVPYAEDGYMVLDTHDNWNAEGIRFDLKVDNNQYRNEK